MPARPALLVLNNTPRADARSELVHRFAGDAWQVDTRWAAGGEFPREPGRYDAIFLSGSPRGAYEDLDWISREHDFVLRAAARHIPMFGVCFGSQLLASALCGRDQVFRRPDCEVGHLWLDISAEARRDALCAGLGPRLRMFVWHNDEVRHDHREMVVLGSTPGCPNQMWRHRSQPVWGVQGHLEITRAEAPQWFERNRARLERDGADVDRLIAEADAAAEAQSILQEFFRFSRGAAQDSLRAGRRPNRGVGAERGRVSPSAARVPAGGRAGSPPCPVSPASSGIGTASSVPRDKETKR